MEITRPSYEPLHHVHPWIERRRVEFDRTSTAVRVIGAVGWSLAVLAALVRLG